jgi:NADH dehydrogenase (ubiquinone) Fe-S protein 1
MISIKINNLEFSVKPGISILEACKYVGVTVPRFCYHELLSVAGNCRMCLVEVEPFEKPVASCVAEVEDNMSIRIDTPFVKKARENVMEILLLNHPLDCPICDQAGECDLQDQAKAFGSNFSRNFFSRKGVEDKYCGPVIKTIMTRCIACTRCVRFGSEIAGVDFFGTLNRGGATEIGNYIQKMFMSEISGNVIDLCPVGALTSKSYAFKSRPWELRVVESVDTSDSLGSNIYVNFKETEIFRVLPKNNVNLNLSLLSDKSRFSFDATSRNRVDTLYEYNQNNRYKKLNWNIFFDKVDSFLDKSNKKINLFLNDEIDLESLLYIKHSKYSNKFQLKTFATTNSKTNSNIYVSPNKFIKDNIDSLNKVAILVGVNLRSENALINTRLRIESSKKFIEVFNIGNSYKDNLPSTFVHFSSNKFMKMFEGKSLTISKSLISSENSLVVFGSGFQSRVDNYSTLVNTLLNINLNLDIVNLHNSCNSDGLAWANVRNNKTVDNKSVLIGLNLSDNYSTRSIFNKKNKARSIWINSHGSFVAANSTYILPSKTLYEEENTYLNQDHIAQKTNVSISGPSNSRSLIQILKSTFEVKSKISYSDHLIEQSKTKNYSTSELGSYYKNFLAKEANKLFKYTLVSTYPIKVLQKDHYISNNLSKNSNNMLNCSEEFKNLSSNF